MEENANLVVRLLIRRPECLGPALRGAGGGLLKAMKDGIIMSEQIAGSRETDSAAFLIAVSEYDDSREHYLRERLVILMTHTSTTSEKGRYPRERLVILMTHTSTTSEKGRYLRERLVILMTHTSTTSEKCRYLRERSLPQRKVSNNDYSCQHYLRERSLHQRMVTTSEKGQ